MNGYEMLAKAVGEGGFKMNEVGLQVFLKAMDLSQKLESKKILVEDDSLPEKFRNIDWAARPPPSPDDEKKVTFNTSYMLVSCFASDSIV